jgi:hypothetical protein
VEAQAHLLFVYTLQATAVGFVVLGAEEVRLLQPSCNMLVTPFFHLCDTLVTPVTPLSNLLLYADLAETEGDHSRVD